MMRHVLIGIHGVGAPRPGEVVDELLSVPAASVRLPIFRRIELVSEGRTVICAEATAAAPFDTILELNWRDLGGLLRGPIGVVRHLFLLVLAMLHAQPGRPTAADRQTWTQRLYRYFFEAYFVWCIWPVAMTLLIHEATSPMLKVMIAIGVAAILFGLTGWFSYFTSTLKAGYGWSCVCVGVGLWQSGHPTNNAGLVYVTALLYSFGQFGTVLLVALVCGHFILTGLREEHTLDQIAARVTLAHAPLVMMAIAGALVWVVVLSVTSTAARATWRTPFLSGLRYDLARVENIATGIIGIPVLVIAGVAAVGYLRQRSQGGPAGLGIQDWLSRFLLVMPVLLTIPGAFLIYGFLTGKPPSNDVLETYATSALRIVPWLGMALVTPIRVLFDVLGDVAFFIVPTDSRLSVRTRTTARLRTLLEQYRGDKVTVVAYSQGTVIALEELRQEDDLTLVTVGAPINSLYKRFLAFDLTVLPGRRTWRWINRWRRSDYIAGRIAAADDDSALKKDGGHLGYFSDTEVWAALTRP